MNETKIKTVSEERDEAIWLMNKTSLELNKTKANLWTANEAIKSMGESLDESRKLAAELNGQIDELRSNYDRVRAAFESQTIECNNLRNQLAATEEALQQVQRASAELRGRSEAARKVADAAVEYIDFKGSVREHMQLSYVLFAAARYYKSLAEPSDVDEKEDGHGFFPGFPPGFDVKRAEKGLAQDGGSQEVGGNEA